MPEISVIVPVFKVEKYLPRCIESILGQTFTDYELILIDDGSPDKCGKICDEYADKDNRVHVIHHQNAGVSFARNTGIEWIFLHSDSKWLTFIDSDDWIHPKMLQILHDAACKTNLPITICDYYETEGSVLEIDTSHIKTKIRDTEDFYLNKNVGATVVWGKLYKKECFKTIRFPEGKTYEDEYVSYKVLFNYSKVAVVEAPLYAYFQNPESFMHSKWNRKKLDGLKALEMQMEFFKRRNLQEIYIDRVRVYIYFSANQYKQCRSVPSMIWISLGLKWKATAKMIIYHKRKILDRKMELYIAEIFFPHLMYVYWLMRALKSKLKNEGLSATIFSVVRYFKNK